MARQAVLFQVLKTPTGKIGEIQLNRPEKLNALTCAMVTEIYQQLVAWRTAPDIKFVLIHSLCPRAYSAGGDLQALYQAGATDLAACYRFFAAEYRLNYYMQQYPKPIVALTDGITMGGGVGISIYASIRIATDRYVFAMPETAIGLYPDVGVSYLFARCPAGIGRYLGLTGSRLSVADAINLGFVDYSISHATIPQLLQTLRSQPAESTEAITALVSALAQPPLARPVLEVKVIEQVFAQASITQIITRLQALDTAWAQSTLQCLQRASPLSLQITNQQILAAAKLSFKQCIERDYQLTQKVLQYGDFFEGVRAKIIDKSNDPTWQMDALEAITPQQLDAYFDFSDCHPLSF